jgi:hypothetical protein
MIKLVHGFWGWIMTYITFEKDRYHEQNDMIEWCRLQFGPGLWSSRPYPDDWTSTANWTIHSMFGRTTFAFRTREAYNWFVLRWS